MLSIAFVIIREFINAKKIRKKIEIFSFCLIEIENFNNFKNKKFEIAFDDDIQQFRHNETRAIYKNEDYYENFFETLKIKLIKIQIKDFVIQKIRA